ncbi:MAG: Uma2 family endonuclease [Gammaproteobacteria bacterium]|nr:Uma2 family endonuclease [Gammaproteobacteria bacterium]
MDTAATTQEAVDAIVRNAVPPQGCWSDTDYLWLAGRLARHLEMTDGRIEQPPMPTETHQLVLQFLFSAFAAFVRPRGGVVLFAPFPLRVREGKYREPDLAVLCDADDARRADARWTGADLVLETVSPDDAARDYVVKRADYAEAGIPEYWIVDPRTELVTVLTLSGDAYAEDGAYGRGDTAVSRVLDGFDIAVDAVFDFARR